MTQLFITIPGNKPVNGNGVALYSDVDVFNSIQGGVETNYGATIDSFVVLQDKIITTISVPTSKLRSAEETMIDQLKADLGGEFNVTGKADIHYQQ